MNTNEMKQPVVLITGLPRSGTTWLVQSLNEHPEILGFGETHFFTRRWVRPSRNGRYTSSGLSEVWRNLSSCPFWATVPLRKDLGKKAGWLTRTSFDDLPEVIESARQLAGPNPTPAGVLDSIGRAFCKREGKSVWVEKTATQGKSVVSIAKKIPDAKFILMMREPVGFFRSYKFQGAQSSRSTREFHSRRYHPFIAALVWRLTYRATRKLRSRQPENTSVFVMSDDDQRRLVLEETCRILDVAPDDAMYGLIGVKVNSSDLKNDRPLDRADLACIRFLCNVDDPGLEIDMDLSEAGVLEFLKAIATLPFWLIRYLRRPRS